MTQFKEPEAMASSLAGYVMTKSYADAVSAVGCRMMKTATVSVFWTHRPSRLHAEERSIENFGLIRYAIIQKPQLRCISEVIPPSHSYRLCLQWMSSVKQSRDADEWPSSDDRVFQASGPDVENAWGRVFVWSRKKDLWHRNIVCKCAKYC